LIVTELVINALKHAFPDERSGKIAVDYWSRGDSWTLSVIDNGVGMPDKAEGIRQGLGTSIVSALASKLEAVVHTTSMQPGTSVAIIRR
jgi:two-component sensor histidine kinase